MKALNFDKLMEHKPFLLDKIVNQQGQTVEFYEHPTKGDSSTVLAVFPEFKAAFDTDFFDTGDFYEDSEYNPIYQDGKANYQYEL